MFIAAGESMIHAPVLDGDWVIVDRSLEAQDWDIVLAAIDGEFTIKTFRRRGRRVWLKPENEAYPDITITAEMDAVICGVVTGSVRQFNRARRATRR